MSKATELPFNYGDIVYLITDPEQEERMVTGVLIQGSQVQYQLTRCTQVSYHLDIEIRTERGFNHLFSQN